MATLNKDFKIKHGLIVEGLQGTINGETILTENAGDQYILDLIGGETLVKSVASGLAVDGTGELSIDRSVVDNWYDESGAAADAQQAAIDHADGLASNYDPAGSAQGAYNNAVSYTDTALESYTPTSSLDTTIDGYGYLKSADLTGYATETYADNAAGTAEQNAKDYADDLINDASSSSTEVWSAYKTSTEIGLAQAAAEQHADDAVAALVDGAPALLDTLNELAAAIADNPNYATDVANLVAGKQDTLTAGANISIDGSDVISVTGLTSAEISDFSTAALSANQGAWDTIGAAAAAQEAAEDYADGLAINYDAAGSASTAQSNAETFATNAINALDTDDIEEGTTNLYFTDSRAKASAGDLLAGATKDNVEITYVNGILSISAENGVADSTTDDLDEGETNLYFTDGRAINAIQMTTPNFATVEIDSVAKQVAATLEAATAGIQVAHTFAKADYRSAEYLVKVAYGTHTEISKVLLTLDTSDNIAITEYGIVGTNGSASSVSAGISGANVQLQVTTANNNSTVTVMGTLLV
jgi:hypothetical protein